MKKIKLTIFISTLFASFSGIVVHADKYGIDQTAGDAGLPKISDVPSALGNVLGVALSMVAVVFFVLMLYAGIRWMLARGNEEQEEKAKETIIGAVVGMVIIMLSYALTTFVFKGTTGGTITNTPATSNSSWDGSYCVMKDKPTVCTKINGDYENCVSNIPPFSTAAECSSALKASATGVIMSCKPAYSQTVLVNLLQASCDSAKSAFPDNQTKMQTACESSKVQGAQICEYIAASNSCTVILNLSNKVNLDAICGQGKEADCGSIKFQLSNVDVGAICEWQ